MEEAAEQEKKNRLAEYFAQVVGDMAEWLTFDDCFNPKWLNATYAESTAQVDINAAIDRCRADLNAIRALQSEFETTLLDEYTRTRNLSAVLVKNETLGRMKAAEEERKRKDGGCRQSTRQRSGKRSTPLKPECIGESDEYEVIDIVGTVEPQRAQPVNDLVDEDGHEMPAAQEPEYKVDFRVFGTARAAGRAESLYAKKRHPVYACAAGVREEKEHENAESDGLYADGAGQEAHIQHGDNGAQHPADDLAGAEERQDGGAVYQHHDRRGERQRGAESLSTPAPSLPPACVARAWA